MSLFTTPNLASTSSLNLPGFIAAPPLLNFIAEWAALIPLVCHLANYHHLHQLAGQVALLGRITVALFPKLGVLAGISKLVERGPELFDIASTLGPSSRKVWDVIWGGTFPCANGAASHSLAESLLKHNKTVIKIPESTPPMAIMPFHVSMAGSGSKSNPEVTVPKEACTLPGMPTTISSSKTHGNPGFRRYQTLHVLHLSKSRRLLSWPSKIDNFLSLPSFMTASFASKLGIVIALCLFGICGTATTLLFSSITQIVSRTLKVHRPSGFLSNNEDHDACMLVATHSNASSWYLFTGDRGVVDSILNKTMVVIPRQRFAGT